MRRTWWTAPLRIALPWTPSAEGGQAQIGVPVSGLQAASRRAAHGIPWVLVILGLAVSIAAVLVLERGVSEAIGSLGVELGAALWFGGSLTLGARRGATVGRALALLGLAAAGVALVALALTRDWSGTALDLALEYGVGAVSVAVIDVLLLGTLHPRLTQFGDVEDQIVTLAIGTARPWVVVSSSSRGGV